MKAELYQFIESKRLKNVSIILSENGKEGIIIADNAPFEAAKVILPNGFSGQVVSSLFIEELIAKLHQTGQLFLSENILLSCRAINLPDLTEADLKKEKIRDLIYLLKHTEDDLYQKVLLSQVCNETIRYYTGSVDDSSMGRLKTEHREVYDHLSGAAPLVYITSLFSSKKAAFPDEVKKRFNHTLRLASNQATPSTKISLLIDDQLHVLKPNKARDSICDGVSLAFLRKELMFFKSWDFVNLVYDYCVFLSSTYPSKNQRVAIIFHHMKVMLKRYKRFDLSQYMMILLKGVSFIENQKLHNVNLEWKINRRLLKMIHTQPLELPSLGAGFDDFLEGFEQAIRANQHQMTIQDPHVIYPRYTFLFIDRLFLFFKISTKEQSRIFSSLFFQDFLEIQH
ncbi:MAG: hypothetical protein AAGA66_14195 [Bacteroidota bacterium]